MLFRSRLNSYKENKRRLETGGINCIPFKHHLPRLSQAVPGIMKEQFYCITSFSNVGKTPLAKFLFVKIPFYYFLKGYDIKILYFALEESREQFLDSLIAAELNELGIAIDTDQLNSISNPIDNNTLTKVEQLEGLFTKLDKCLTVISHLKTPSEIYNYILKFAKTRGKFLLDGEPATDKFDEYVPNNPNEFCIVVIDHINEMTDGNKDKRIVLEDHNSNMMNVYTLLKYIPCNVHQQAAEGENEKYSHFTKNEPSLTTLGDNKALQRQYTLVFGLSVPQRYGRIDLPEYKIKLNTDLLLDYFRGLTILKNRRGRLVKCPLRLYPNHLKFTEL